MSKPILAAIGHDNLSMLTFMCYPLTLLSVTHFVLFPPNSLSTGSRWYEQVNRKMDSVFNQTYTGFIAHVLLTLPKIHCFVIEQLSVHMVTALISPLCAYILQSFNIVDFFYFYVNRVSGMITTLVVFVFTNVTCYIYYIRLSTFVALWMLCVCYSISPYQAILYFQAQYHCSFDAYNAYMYRFICLIDIRVVVRKQRVCRNCGLRWE